MGWQSVRAGVAWISRSGGGVRGRGSQAAQQGATRACSGPWWHVRVWRGQAAPFLIVDRQLAVQAFSRRTEVVLSVDEPAAVGIPLEELLICDNGHCDNGEVAALGRARDG